MSVFNGERLTTARLYRCLTIGELAVRTGISSLTIRKHESGKGIPTIENQRRYSEVLGFPIAFWQANKTVTVDANEVSFRSFRRVPAWVKGRAIAEAQIACEVILNWLDSRFYLPKVSFCQLPDKMSPEDASKYLRMFWQIGCLPVEHLLKFLEGKGIRVFSFSHNIKSLDACSFWTQDGQPVILVDSSRSAERVRFSLMHEVGHLLMHKDRLAHNKTEEEEADAFSSAFLMPQPVFGNNVPSSEAYNTLIQYKHYWGVSLSALYYRMRKLGLMSDWNFRSKMVSLSSTYGRTKEPSPLPSEESGLFGKVADILRQHGETGISLSLELGIPDDVLRALCFGIPEKVQLRFVPESTEPIYLPTHEKQQDDSEQDEIWYKDETSALAPNCLMS